jgi:hypothetical protein
MLPSNTILKNLKKNSLKLLKNLKKLDFIDSEEYLQAQKAGKQYYAKVLKVLY